MSVVADSPLSLISQDRFGREPLVELVVDSINQVVSSDHTCLTYGVYGKWGEGKTSFLNFIKNRLVEQGKSDRINLVEFNPWLVNNDEALLREFFKAIMKTPDDAVKNALLKYGSAAIFASKTLVNNLVPGLGTKLADWVGLAKDAMKDSQDSLSELKQKVSEAIEASGRHLVVMIDDVDRLDKDEMHAVLRLIRQVADFSNCIYIVAMDVDMVADSIGKYHGKGNSMDGRKYIDKIIQIPVSLPKVPDHIMKSLISDELNEILMAFSSCDGFQEIIEAISPLITTYRELKRYRNQISFVLPHLKDEVNIKELCLLEAIKLVSTESYNRIYESKDLLAHVVDTHKLHAGRYSFSIEKNDNYQKAKNYVLQGLDTSLKDNVGSVLDDLFNDDYVEDWDLDHKRAITSIYFSKYFTLSVPSDLIPDSKLEAFIAALRNLQLDAMANQFDRWAETYSVSEVERAALYIIRQEEDDKKRYHKASHVAESLSLSRLAREMKPEWEEDTYTIATFVAKHVIREHLFEEDADTGKLTAPDAGLLNDTLSYVFRQGKMNYCMHLISSADELFNTDAFDGSKALGVLTKRFSNLPFKEQFMFDRFMLVKFLSCWKQVDEPSFNQYAKNLFENPEIPCLTVFEKFMGESEGGNINDFTRLFKNQASIIDVRLQGESDTVRRNPLVTNYVQISHLNSELRKRFKP